MRAQPQGSGPKTAQPFAAMPAYDRLPLVGQYLDFKRRVPWQGTARVARDVGPLCRMSLPFLDIVILNDPDAIRYVLEEAPQLFFKGAPGPALLPVATQASMFVQPGGERWKQARDANPMGRAVDDGWLDRVVPDLEELVTERLAAWKARSARVPFYDAYDEFRHLAFDAFSKTLFGERFGDDVYRRFVYVANGFDFRIKLGLPVMPPLPPWRSMAMHRYTGLLAETVTRRRGREDDKGSDLLSLTIRGGLTSPAGVLAAQLNSLIFSGAFSMSTAIAATLYELGRSRGALKKVQGAVDAMLAKGPLTRRRILRCAPLQGAVMEAMRVKPPVALFVRQVNRDRPVLLGGYEVPPKTTLLISCKHLHVSADHWEAPLHYRPERWTRAGRERDPFGSDYFFPFGRGPRSCYAQAYAELFVPLAVALILGHSRPEVGRGQPWREDFWFGCMVPKYLSARFQDRTDGPRP